MFRVVAFDALPGTVALVNRTPGGHKGGERTHVLHWCAAAACGRGYPRHPLFVQQTLRTDTAQSLADDFERFFPTDRHKSRVLVTALEWVGALHWLADSMRVVGFLYQSIGLDTDPPTARVLVSDIKV